MKFHPAIALAFCAAISASPVFAADYGMGRVVRVSSGDTLWIRFGKVNRKVRIFGIDAPEKGQPYFARSREALRKYIGNRRVYISEVRVKGNAGEPGVIAAHVHLQGVRGRNSAGYHMVAAGLAWVRPGAKVESSFRRMQARARRKKLGLWRSAKPVAPWLYKRGSGKGCKIAVVKPKCK